FDASAQRYDAARRPLIPCLDAFYVAAVAAAAPPPDKDLLLVGLCAATGLLTAWLSAASPSARAVQKDLSDCLLDITRRRYAARQGPPAGGSRRRDRTADRLDAGGLSQGARRADGCLRRHARYRAAPLLRPARPDVPPPGLCRGAAAGTGRPDRLGTLDPSSG